MKSKKKKSAKNKKSNNSRFFGWVKAHFRKVLEVKKCPHSIAFGFSIGTFISILPTPGLNLLLGGLLILFYHRINKLTLVAALLFWNYLITAPVNIVGYHVGDVILREGSNVSFSFFNVSAKLILGNMIIGLVVSAVSYFVIRESVVYYRSRRK